MFGDAFQVRVYLREVRRCVSDFGLERELFGAGGEAGGEDLVFLRDGNEEGDVRKWYEERGGWWGALLRSRALGV